LLSALQLPIL
ncbi:hypothetical protein D046_6536B, partial [Vibrio parahaemolyticus V-223/04]